MTAIENKGQQHLETRVTLVLFNLMFSLLLIPWFPLAVWSLVFLNDPSVNFVVSRLLPLSVLAYPLFLLAGIVLGWRSFKRNNSGRAVLQSVGIPLLSILPWLAAWIFMAGRSSP